MLKNLRLFYSFLSGKKFWFVVFIVFVLASSVAGSVVPYFYKIFVDAIPSRDFHRLLIILIVYIAFRVFEMLLNMASYTVGDYLLIDSASRARSELFQYVQDLDFAFHTDKSTGKLISIFKRGDGAFFSLFHSLHFRIINVLVSFLVMLYVFMQLNLLISLVIIISFVLTLIATKFLITVNITARRRFNREEDNISSIIVDNLIGYETVKLFAKEAWELSRLKKAFHPWGRTLWTYGQSFRLFDAVLGAVIYPSIFLVFYLCLKLTVSGQMTIGEFVLVIGFVSSFYPRVWDLLWGFREIAKNYVDIQRYFGLFDQSVLVKDPVDAVKLSAVNGEINFNHVSFSYRGGQKNALRHLSLKVRQGQSIALVGRSGSGKTTLIKLLMRFYDPDSGTITLDGVNLNRFAKSYLRSFIGVVPQEPVLFNHTIGYNIGYGKPSATKREIIAAAKLANIDRFISSLKRGYATPVGERGIKLSGGQKQRLAIARMILSDPEIVIFDEATSQLDSESERLIQDAFWKASQNKTTIIIAHRLSTVIRADKIVVMERGRIVETGSHQELIQKPDSLYHHFWSLQNLTAS